MITGKKFENQFRKDWLKSFPNSLILRLPDQQSGYAGGGSRNPCDFICFVNKKLFMIECKSHGGNTIPFNNLRQYDLLKSYENIEDVYTGFICWFYDHNKVIYIPTTSINQMKNDNKKSINIKEIDDYYHIDIPSELKRTFMTSNYSVLLNH